MSDGEKLSTALTLALRIVLLVYLLVNCSRRFTQHVIQLAAMLDAWSCLLHALSCANEVRLRWQLNVVGIYVLYDERCHILLLHLLIVDCAVSDTCCTVLFFHSSVNMLSAEETASDFLWPHVNSRLTFPDMQFVASLQFDCILRLLIQSMSRPRDQVARMKRIVLIKHIETDGRQCSERYTAMFIPACTITAEVVLNYSGFC